MRWTPPIEFPMNAYPSVEFDDSHAYPAFAPAVSDEFGRMKGLPKEKTVKSGVVLVEQGLAPSSVFLLLEGLVKLTTVSRDGREIVLGLRTAGWYAGAVTVLAHATSVYSVKTLTECVVSVIPAEELPQWLARSARMTRHLTQVLCNELMSQTAEAQVMGESAEERLGRFMAERRANHPTVKTIDALPQMKQKELAQLLAITPEHLSRLLRKSAMKQQAEDSSEAERPLDRMRA